MRYQPRYIRETELKKFGLPGADEQANIMALVDGASTFIDEWCGRVGVDGEGSLAYSTYVERKTLPPQRNIIRLSNRPLVAITASVRADLAASADAGQIGYYTGFTENTTYRGSLDGPTTQLSPIIAASGRYGYGRRSVQNVYPDSNYGVNPLMIAAFFGGPPQFTGIDVGTIDFDPRTAEIWIPAGVYWSQYTEVDRKR